MNQTEDIIVGHFPEERVLSEIPGYVWLRFGAAETPEIARIREQDLLPCPVVIKGDVNALNAAIKWPNSRHAVEFLEWFGRGVLLTVHHHAPPDEIYLARIPVWQWYREHDGQ